MHKLIIAQFWVLLAGTLFAWTNFTIELVSWIGKTKNEFSCSPGEVATNPFLTPCFYGALVFTVAFVIATIIWKKSKK